MTRRGRCLAPHRSEGRHVRCQVEVSVNARKIRTPCRWLVNTSPTRRRQKSDAFRAGSGKTPMSAGFLTQGRIAEIR